MFALRGAAVTLSVFAMVYCALSLAVCLSWARIWIRIQTWARRPPESRVANLLFTLRLFPLATAVVITAAFTVPSFLLLEPRAINEPLGGLPLALGLCGLGIGIFGAAKVFRAIRKASHTISAWTREAQSVSSATPVPVLRISRPIPPMSAVGIVRPRILLSSAAESVLAADELRAALKHEIAHIRRRDNLKKLLLRFVAFPGMSGLEMAWLEAAEMAADDAAVSTPTEALDLAATLIKLSRLGPVAPPVDLSAALVHSPASIMNARVERLISWSQQRQSRSRGNAIWCGVLALCAAAGMAAVTYSEMLAHVHTATEWLVR
ncbi:MAG TPA: M56 family metallopeptidase [Candidatus Dormibacteraeota bacterium]|nr:M56 family metallopeptidase [Candidatus Dormibacteraeota bacterium]